MGECEIGLFCKSFVGDLERFHKLIESVDRYNLERIPFFVSVPESDVELFTPLLAKRSYAKLLTDEDLLIRSDAMGKKRARDFSGSLLQQIIKVAFGMIGHASRYVVIDSDSFFLRPFGKRDFLCEDGNPVTIMHNCEDLLEFCEAKGMHFVKTNYEKERKKLQGLFGRTGDIYDFGPTPVVWGIEVWQKLKADYLIRNNISLATLISRYPSELLVYGEALLKYKPFPIKTRGPLFKVFHYEEQFDATEGDEEAEKKLSQKYFGIVMQSNWNQNSKKLTATKRFGRFLKNLIRRK
ncbi:MAG: DUF6492 family protein [Verrucomicrobia bacterium]|nr:DUF6492 family protein [Verrucomicrobiota bacterium]